MNFYHYSAAPFVLDNARVYTQPEGHFKPCGLWLSVEEGTEEDHGWKQWCECEEFSLEGLRHRTPVTLCGGNILAISSPNALHSFTREFKAPSGYYGDVSIDWRLVAARYDGIVITPYQWTCRLDHNVFWYYSWDCASACIWNASVLEVAQEVTA